MSKTFLFFKSALKLAIVFFGKIFLYLSDRVKIVLSLVKALYMLRHEVAFNISEAEPLENIRPDTGKLSEIFEFSAKEPRFDLSIIIPVYNCEDYISECIESVLNQKTNYSYEIIVVDDGSTDSTGEVLKKYAKDTRIKALSQENHGQAYARNRAIEKSSGRFLMMLDADDVLLENAIQSLLDSAIKTGSDIAEGKYIRFVKWDNSYTPKVSAYATKIIKSKKSVLSCTGYSWAKIYNRSLWQTLRYPEGYIFEDVITKFILRRKSNQIAYINDFVYGYRHIKNSSSHKIQGMKHLDSIWVYPRIVSLCKSENVPLDGIFYLLSLNHIALLNYITVSLYEKDVQLSCFAEMRKQLNSIQFCRPKRIPFLFYLLEQSVLKGKFKTWHETAKTVFKYRLLKNWREIN